MNVVIRTETSRLDVDAIHAFLTRSYWAKGVSRERVAKSLEGSLCFGVYDDERQIGFARVITDRATFRYLCDVHRGRGLGKRLIQAVRAHPDLCALRSLLLKTRDAHGLYEPFGFERVGDGRDFMQIKGEPP